MRKKHIFHPNITMHVSNALRLWSYLNWRYSNFWTTHVLTLNSMWICFGTSKRTMLSRTLCLGGTVRMPTVFWVEKTNTIVRLLLILIDKKYFHKSQRVIRCAQCQKIRSNFERQYAVAIILSDRDTYTTQPLSMLNHIFSFSGSFKLGMQQLANQMSWYIYIWIEFITQCLWFNCG